MNKLPENFTSEKYGLTVRLVKDIDAPFILNLRTDNKLDRFLHSTVNINEHLKWMKDYRKREQEGRDYYFIYFKDGLPVGVNRIYNIYDYYGTIGSWICNPNNDAELSIATYFFMLDILFEFLGLNLTVFDVRKKNTQVIRLHQKVGAEIVGESEVDLYFVLNKSNYLSHRSFFVDLF